MGLISRVSSRTYRVSIMVNNYEKFNKIAPVVELSRPGTANHFREIQELQEVQRPGTAVNGNERQVDAGFLESIRTLKVAKSNRVTPLVESQNGEGINGMENTAFDSGNDEIGMNEMSNEDVLKKVIYDEKPYIPLTI